MNKNKVQIIIFLFTLMFATYSYSLAANKEIICGPTDAPCVVSPNRKDPIFDESEDLLYDVKPGDYFEREITVRNQRDEECHFSLDRGKLKTDTAEFSKVLLTQINDGSYFTGEYSLYDLLNITPLYLTTIPAGGSKTLLWYIKLDPMVGNDYQNARVVFDFDWDFSCGQAPPEPVLFIEKTNNKMGIVQEPGDDVTYTLTITAGEFEPVFNVQVLDLPPGGFSYVSGTWTAFSDVRGDIKGTITTEPTYASPGQWNLGDMQPGEVVTLTYLADISTSQESGLYKDLAWTYGNQTNDTSSPLVYGNESTGFFVGTHAEVAVEPDFDVKVEVETEEIEEVEELEGDVLGDSIELPATGRSLLWTVIPLITLMFGIFLMGFKVPNIKSLLLILTALLITQNNVFASNVSIRLQEPESPNSQENFYLNYVALDLLGRSIDVNCYKKAPGEPTFSQLGSTKTLPAGGDDNYCYVTSSMLPDDGVYQFYVEANASGDISTSTTVSVDYDSDKPGKPKWIVKEKDGSCKYKVEFRTAADGGDTVEARVFRSEDKEFDANPSSQIKVVSIGSDQKYDFTDTKPNCGKKYYYAVQAFDSAGNGSTVRAETVEKTVTITKTIEGEEGTEVLPTVVTEAPFVGVIGTGTGGEAGEGVEETPGEEEGEEIEVVDAGTVEGISDEEDENGDVLGDKSSSTLRKIIRLWPIGLIAVVVSYLYAKRKREEK